MTYNSVLIVDDEPDLRDLLVEALQTQGYESEGAPDGPTALARIREKHFPVIFTDLNMPGLSGLELIKAIKEQDPKAFTILMTGYATTESAIQAVKRGAYDFIQKPFKLAEIDASLKRALEHYTLLRQNEAYQTQLEEMVAERTGEILKLKEDIERLFESFVNASITAIESRDPSTSGHSQRVATLTVGLAEVVNRTLSGPYGGIHFSDKQIREVRYASLLHDFGKVGVREHLLVKAKKLEPERLEQILQRLYQRDLERTLAAIDEAWNRGAGYDPQRTRLVLTELRRETDALVDLVRKSNEPKVLPEDVAAELARLEALTVEHWSGTPARVVEDVDLERLRIKRGSLSHEEREEINLHVTHTFRFLRQIPWTHELAAVPEIAYAHHERLNGRGYPRNLKAEDIPVQSKIMSISDVFDALAAKDRPYKQAVSVERSLQIIEEEAKDGLLDRDLFALFLEGRVYDLTSGEPAGAAP